MNIKEFLQRESAFLFSCFFVFFIVLAVLELLMPGFVIYYFNLSWLLVAVFALAFARLLVQRDN
ncbi:MAG: hypothetical protein AAB575_01140 [Patescibacteria group bacterium]